MKAVQPANWKGGLVLLCSKCGRKLEGRNREPLKELRRWLKQRLKERGLSKSFRVVKSGCLDVCPKGRMTVAIAAFQGAKPLQCFVVDPAEDREELLERIIASLPASASGSYQPSPRMDL